MNSKLKSLILAGLLVCTQHGHAFNTALSVDIIGPINGGSGIFDIRVGTVQNIGSILAQGAYGAYTTLLSTFNTAYTFTNVNGADVGNNPIAVQDLDVVSPYSDAGGYDNTIFWFLTDSTNTTFALFRGTGEWGNGQPFAADAMGLAWDSVTSTGFGSIDTGAGSLSATAIPEPASGSLFLLGAAGVLALRRLRKTNV